MINFNVPPFTGREIEYIRQAVENQKICGDGPFTQKCSEWIEAQTGTAKCLLTTSCTHATELAALLADIQEGDEVIMPSYTFVSTADAFVLRGGVAVFVDIRPDTMNIDEKPNRGGYHPENKGNRPGALRGSLLRDGQDYGACKKIQPFRHRGRGAGHYGDLQGKGAWNHRRLWLLFVP